MRPRRPRPSCGWRTSRHASSWPMAASMSWRCVVGLDRDRDLRTGMPALVFGDGLLVGLLGDGQRREVRRAAAVGGAHRGRPGVARGDVAELEVRPVVADVAGERMFGAGRADVRRVGDRLESGRVPADSISAACRFVIGAAPARPRPSRRAAGAAGRRRGSGPHRREARAAAALRRGSFPRYRSAHTHHHLSQVDEPARGEVQGSPVPERSIATGCTQDRTATQGMHALIGVKVRANGVIGIDRRDGIERKRSRAVAAASSSSAARAATVAASRSAGPSSVEPSTPIVDGSRSRSARCMAGR